MPTKTCPKCQKPMRHINKPGQYEFWGCTGYPTCRHTEEVEDPNAPECPSCGAKMQKKNGSKGQFWGCTAYPTCKKTVPFNGN